LRTESWKALEELKKEGKIRSIGVSNYGVHHMKELLEIATIKPTINQIEVIISTFMSFLYKLRKLPSKKLYADHFIFSPLCRLPLTKLERSYASSVMTMTFKSRLSLL
jgi:predicted oxidoreductase